jgi:predicted DNA-binding transcriptional regulator YafY
MEHESAKNSAENKQNNQKSVASLLRQWQLLHLLPSRAPGITVTELLDKLKEDYRVERKTIERDLLALSEYFPLQCNDKSKPYGWYWAGSHQLPGMTLQEALLLQLADPMLRQLLPSFVTDVLGAKINEAKRLLAKNQQHKTLRLSEKLAFVAGPQLQQPPRINAECLLAVQTALFNDCCVQVYYQSPYTEHAEHGRIQLLHPVAMVQSGLQLYLLAVVDGYEDVRLFALSRVLQATITEQEALRPTDFNLQDYLAAGGLQFLSGGLFQMTARVNAKLARLLEESPLGEQMQLNYSEPEWPVLTTMVQDSWNLRMWLLSQGSNIEVQSPALLRQQMVDELKDTLALYKE